MTDRERLDRDGDLASAGVPYNATQIVYLENLSDDDVLVLISTRYREVLEAERLTEDLRRSLKYLVLYVYKRRPEIPVVELARRTGLRKTAIYETYLGDGRVKRRKKKGGGDA